MSRLLVKGGRVVDPSQELDAVCDVGEDCNSCAADCRSPFLPSRLAFSRLLLILS